MRFLNGICRILWFFLSIMEKIFWFINRNVQKQKFCHAGKNVYIGRYSTFLGLIIIGNDVSIGQYCRFQTTSSKIIIGSHVMFGPNVSIHGGNHRIDIVGRYMKSIQLDEKRPEDDQDVIIGDDVWVGANAIILKGVNIGNGAVIGAGCVITKDIPPYTIVTGNNLRVMRKRWNEKDEEIHKSIINQNYIK